MYFSCWLFADFGVCWLLADRGGGCRVVQQSLEEVEEGEEGGLILLPFLLPVAAISESCDCAAQALLYMGPGISAMFWCTKLD